MAKKLFWIIVILLFGYFLIHPAVDWGGDIIEYYGTTESLISHGSPKLTTQDKSNIEKVLNPAYFNDPQYYIKAKSGDRYPVHFIFYSILLIPMRLILELIGLNPIKTIAITNLIILSTTIYIIINKLISNPRNKLIFLITAFLSPLLYFIAWPGPEIFYTCFLLLAVFMFFNRGYFEAALLVTIASWQSQPIVVLALGFILFYGYKNILKRQISIKLLILFLLLAIPYIYSFFIFGLFSPWGIIKNMWTSYYGFGIQNVGVKKIFEQLFDPNIGIFWYMPIVFIFGFFSFLKTAFKEKRVLYLLVFFTLTALAYQTNPAWNYGTSGFGPTRYSLFLLPILLYFFIDYIKSSRKTYLIILIYFLTQFYILSFNGFLIPNFFSALDHSPYAKYVLNSYPQTYNPSPEIFVDRTNHTDLDHFTSAIYKNNGSCKKAYVLLNEKQKLIDECGYVPQKYLDKFTNNYSFEGFYINY